MTNRYEQFKAAIKEKAKAAIPHIQAKWLVVQPKLQPYWDQFRNTVEKLFALSDHSAMRAPRIVLRVCIAFFVLFFFWATFFHIDQVVNAQGQVIADSKTQILQAADGGVLVEMKVKEGDSVEKGQVIAILEKNRAQAAYYESLGKVTALRMTVWRLQAELAEKPLQYDQSLKDHYPDLVETQMNLYQKRRLAYLEQVTVLKDNVRLSEQELAMNLPLEAMGDISKADVLKLKRAVNEARGALANQRNKYFQDASTDLYKAEEDLNAQEQTLADREQLLEHTDIVAPAAGIVKSIKVTTLGGVVRQGDEILQILPTESDLIIEAKVKPADMAYMKVGLPAKVKLDAYDYSIFGTMKGKVSYVSADALTEDTKNGPLTYYRVKVNIGEKDFLGSRSKDIEVRPGMTATVDIKTGDRTVLSYIMKPITKTLGSAFGER
jgi:adhesin transport system membrane fusion protein